MRINFLTVSGLLVILFWTTLGVLASWIAPYDPLISFEPLISPGGYSKTGDFFLLGTDHLGRDVLSRILYGTQNTFFWSWIATFSAYLVGSVPGLLAGYYGGKLEKTLSFMANVVLSFPVIVLYVIIITSVGASGTNVVLAVTFATAPVVYRIILALTLDVRTRDYVAAAKVRGENDFYVLTSEILPNAFPPLIADFCLRFGYTIITIGVLGFLGLGLPPPTPDWGNMINEGRAMAISFPHLLLFPCLGISSLVISLNLIADGLKK